MPDEFLDGLSGLTGLVDLEVLEDLSGNPITTINGGQQTCCIRIEILVNSDAEAAGVDVASFKLKVEKDGAAQSGLFTGGENPCETGPGFDNWAINVTQHKITGDIASGDAFNGDSASLDVTASALYHLSTVAPTDYSECDVIRFNNSDSFDSGGISEFSDSEGNALTYNITSNENGGGRLHIVEITGYSQSQCDDTDACNDGEMEDCIYPPTISTPQTKTTLEHPNSVSIDLNSYVSNSSGALSYEITTDPTKGTLSEGSAGVFTYSPNVDVGVSGDTDSFRWRVTDADTCVSEIGDVNITITDTDVYGCTNSNACNYDVTATSDDASCVVAPIINGATGECANDSTFQITLSNYIGTAGSGDTFDQYAIVSQPSYGSIELNAGVITYTPSSEFIGSDTFSWEVGNSVGCTSNSASVVMTVTAGAPTRVTTTKDISYSFTGGSITGFEFAVSGVTLTNVHPQEASVFNQVNMVISDGQTQGALAVDTDESGDEISTSSGVLVTISYDEEYPGELTPVISQPVFEGPGGVNFESISTTGSLAGNDFSFSLIAPEDCDGTAFGAAVEDECGNCGGSGAPEGYDCNGDPIDTGEDQVGYEYSQSAPEFRWEVNNDLDTGQNLIIADNVLCSRVESFQINSAAVHLINEIESRLPNIRANQSFDGAPLDEGNRLADDSVRYFEDSAEGTRDRLDFERSINDIAYSQATWSLTINGYNLSWGQFVRTAKERSSLTLSSDTSWSTPDPDACTGEGEDVQCDPAYGGQAVPDEMSQNVNGYRKFIEDYTSGEYAIDMTGIYCGIPAYVEVTSTTPTYSDGHPGLDIAVKLHVPQDHRGNNSAATTTNTRVSWKVVRTNDASWNSAGDISWLVDGDERTSLLAWSQESTPDSGDYQTYTAVHSVNLYNENLGQPGTPGYPDLMTVAGALDPASLPYGIQCVLVSNSDNSTWEEAHVQTGLSVGSATLAPVSALPPDIESDPLASGQVEGVDYISVDDVDVPGSWSLAATVTYYWGLNSSPANTIIDTDPAGTWSLIGTDDGDQTHAGINEHGDITFTEWDPDGSVEAQFLLNDGSSSSYTINLLSVIESATVEEINGGISLSLGTSGNALVASDNVTVNDLIEFPSIPAFSISPSLENYSSMKTTTEMDSRIRVTWTESDDNGGGSGRVYDWSCTGTSLSEPTLDLNNASQLTDVVANYDGGKAYRAVDGQGNPVGVPIFTMDFSISGFAKDAHGNFVTDTQTFQRTVYAKREVTGAAFTLSADNNGVTGGSGLTSGGSLTTSAPNVWDVNTDTNAGGWITLIFGVMADYDGEGNPAGTGETWEYYVDGNGPYSGTGPQLSIPANSAHGTSYTVSFSHAIEGDGSNIQDQTINVVNTSCGWGAWDSTTFYSPNNLNYGKVELEICSTGGAVDNPIAETTTGPIVGIGISPSTGGGFILNSAAGSDHSITVSAVDGQPSLDADKFVLVGDKIELTTHDIPAGVYSNTYVVNITLCSDTGSELVVTTSDSATITTTVHDCSCDLADWEDFTLDMGDKLLTVCTPGSETAPPDDVTLDTVSGQVNIASATAAETLAISDPLFSGVSWTVVVDITNIEMADPDGNITTPAAVYRTRIKNAVEAAWITPVDNDSDTGKFVLSSSSMDILGALDGANRYTVPYQVSATLCDSEVGAIENIYIDAYDCTPQITSINIYYDSDYDIESFGFDVSGGTVVSVGGGDAASAGLSMGTNGTSVMGNPPSGPGPILAAGSGTLLILEVQDADSVCISNVALQNGETVIPGVAVTGCDTVEATCVDEWSYNHGGSYVVQGFNPSYLGAPFKIVELVADIGDGGSQDGSTDRGDGFLLRKTRSDDDYNAGTQNVDWYGIEAFSGIIDEAPPEGQPPTGIDFSKKLNSAGDGFVDNAELSRLQASILSKIVKYTGPGMNNSPGTEYYPSDHPGRPGALNAPGGEGTDSYGPYYVDPDEALENGRATDTLYISTDAKYAIAEIPDETGDGQPEWPGGDMSPYEAMQLLGGTGQGSEIHVQGLLTIRKRSSCPGATEEAQYNSIEVKLYDNTTAPREEVDVDYNTDSDIAEFEFEVTGATDVEVVAGSGDAGSANFTMSYNSDSNTVIGTKTTGSITAGSGTLLKLSVPPSDRSSLCINDAVLEFRDAEGTTLDSSLDPENCNKVIIVNARTADCDWENWEKSGTLTTRLNIGAEVESEPQIVVCSATGYSAEEDKGSNPSTDFIYAELGSMKSRVTDDNANWPGDDAYTNVQVSIDSSWKDHLEVFLETDDQGNRDAVIRVIGGNTKINLPPGTYTVVYTVTAQICGTTQQRQGSVQLVVNDCTVQQQETSAPTDCCVTVNDYYAVTSALANNMIGLGEFIYAYFDPEGDVAKAHITRGPATSSHRDICYIFRKDTCALIGFRVAPDLGRGQDGTELTLIVALNADWVGKNIKLPGYPPEGETVLKENTSAGDWDREAIYKAINDGVATVCCIED